MKKFLPPLLLLATGMYFWWTKADSAPSEILTTWKTGTDYRLLTLYQGTSKNAVDGYFYNSRSVRIEGMVRSTYRDSVLTGYWFQSRIQTNAPPQKNMAPFIGVNIDLISAKEVSRVNGLIATMNWVEAGMVETKYHLCWVWQSQSPTMVSSSATA